MAKRFLWAVMILGSLAGGVMLGRCARSGQTDTTGEKCRTEADTVTYVDTIRYYVAAPAKEVSLGSRITFLPVFIPSGGNNDSVNIPTICNNDVKNIPDSVAVEIPITQREYEGEDYHAWVSGYEPRLDSIFVFARHDVVNVREAQRVYDRRPRRWGVGVFVGYGVTPHGLQPCGGISLSYNLWNF